MTQANRQLSKHLLNLHAIFGRVSLSLEIAHVGGYVISRIHNSTLPPACDTRFPSLLLQDIGSSWNVEECIFGHNIFFY